MNNQCSTLINDCKYKVVFLGDANVGKTSLVQHILHGTFNSTYQPTLFLQSAKKSVMHKGQIYKLMLWDTAGQQKFNSLIPSFVRGCDCAVIVYDVNNRQSLLNCQRWLNMLKQEKADHCSAVVLVGSKIDLPKDVGNGQGFDLAIKHKLSHVEASALNGKGIENLVYQIVESIDRSKNKSEKDTRSSQGSTSQKLTISQGPSEIKIKKQSNCCAI